MKILQNRGATSVNYQSSLSLLHKQPNIILEIQRKPAKISKPNKPG